MTSAEYDQEKAFNEEIAKITDENIKEKLIKMKELVVKRIQLEREFRVEQNKLEAKYEAIYAPIYKDRSAIINGEKTITADEVKDVLKDVKVESDENKETGIPEYWLTCLKNTNQFGELINSKDESVLKHLKDITLEYKEDGNFSVFFHFTPNDFFQGTVLYRNFILDEKQNIKKIESSKINWASEEVNPTVAKKKKKLKNKSKPTEVKTVIKVEPVESFFNFFKDYTASEEKEGAERKKSKNEEEDDEDIDDNEFIEEEYELGVFIKDELIPYSLEYYLDLVDDEDLDDDFDDEEEDEEDEDDDEEDKKPKKKLF
jgi:nucleosome assembly protein 1-like 1